MVYNSSRPARMIRKAVLVIIFGYAGFGAAEAVEYGVVVTPAPVLNSPDFASVFGGQSGHELKTDRCGQTRELEYIALPGTAVTILKELKSGTVDICQIETEDYSAAPNVRLYMECRFLVMKNSMPEQRRPLLPTRAEVVSTLRAASGRPYVWGSNAPTGIPELAVWFTGGISDNERERLTLAGLDCSGLLYHATGGWTPRNTSQLVSYGHAVVIAGNSPVEIAAKLQPLDLIVWNGHVVIVLDQLTTIESRLECGAPGNGGVVTTPLSQRLAAIMRTRHPVNVWPVGKKGSDIFVVRRWYPL